MINAIKLSNILFLISGVLFTVELWPQIYKTYRSRKAKDISIFFLITCMVAYICFIISSILIKNWFLVISHCIPFVNLSILFVLVLKYRKKKRGISK